MVQHRLPDARRTAQKAQPDLLLGQEMTDRDEGVTVPCATGGAATTGQTRQQPTMRPVTVCSQMQMVAKASCSALCVMRSAAHEAGSREQSSVTSFQHPPYYTSDIHNQCSTMFPMTRVCMVSKMQAAASSPFGMPCLLQYTTHCVRGAQCRQHQALLLTF